MVSYTFHCMCGVLTFFIATLLLTKAWLFCNLRKLFFSSFALILINKKLQGVAE